MSKDINPNTIIRWITAIFILAVLILFGVFSIYAIHFYREPNPTDSRAAWGQFGDFIGGTSNPILALLTLTGLLLTTLLQVKQLQNSRKELDETRAMISQSNRAQEKAASELAKQALAGSQTSDLEAVKVLLEQYRIDLTSFESQNLVASDPRWSRVRQLKNREAALLNYIDLVYNRILPNHTKED